MRKNEIVEQLLNSALPRLEELWQRADKLPEEQEVLMWESLDHLSEAFEELYIALEETQLRNEELEAANLSLAAERRRYQELFEFAPGGYLVTDSEGVIQEANQAAANLLGMSQTLYLAGKPLFVFLVEDARRDFYNQLNQLRTGKELRDWELLLQPRQNNPILVACTVTVVQNPQGEVLGLRWLLKDITEGKQVQHYCSRCQ